MGSQHKIPPNKVNCRNLTNTINNFPFTPEIHSKWRCCVTPKCEICNLQRKIYDTSYWFQKVGRKYQQKFVSKLILLCNSSDILQYLIQLLNVVDCKDAVYSLVRRKPAKDVPNPTRLDPNISKNWMKTTMEETWFWFSKSNVWTKTNFLLLILSLADLQLLRSVRNEMRGLLAFRTQMTKAGFLPTNCQCQEKIKLSSTLSRDEEQQLNKLLEDANLLSRRYRKKSDSHPLSMTNLRVLPSGTVLYSEMVDKIKSRDTTLKSSLIEKGVYIIVDRKLDGVFDDIRVDFSVDLPIPLLQKVVTYLDNETLTSCIEVDGPLKMAAQHVLKSRVHIKKRSLSKKRLLPTPKKTRPAFSPNEMAPIELNPSFALDVLVVIPMVDNKTQLFIPDVNNESFDESLMFAHAYEGIKTRRVLMEMRNVYCSDYVRTLLIKKHDLTRIVHHDGAGPLVAVGGLARGVKFFSLNTFRPVQMSIQRRSVRCIELVQNERVVFTGGYDTSVRCWSLRTARCKKVFLGHKDTILCLSVHGNYLAAGCKDGVTKVWNYVGQKFLYNFSDRHAVTAVNLGNSLCVTGCKEGSVRVFSLFNGKLLKQLTSHAKMVTSVKIHRWFILTASRDTLARLWSAPGKVRTCLTEFHHPHEVTNIEFYYLRVITSCWDGCLRIWDAESGRLLKLLYPGDKRSLSPILSFHLGNNRIIVNTIAAVVVLRFTPVKWNYPGVQNVDTPVRPSDNEWSVVQSKPLSTGRGRICHFSGIKETKKVKDAQWTNGIRSSLTPHAVRMMKTFLRMSKKDKSIRPWSTSSLTDLRPHRLSLTLDEAKSILWSQKRTPFRVPPPEPINSFLKKQKHPVLPKIKRTHSMSQLDDPQVLNEVSRRAADLHSTIEIERQSKKSELLWKQKIQFDGHVFWDDKKLPNIAKRPRPVKVDHKTSKTVVVQSQSPGKKVATKQKSTFSTTGGWCDEVKVHLWRTVPPEKKIVVPTTTRRNPFKTTVDLHLT